MQIIGGLIKRLLFWSNSGLILFWLIGPETRILEPWTLHIWLSRANAAEGMYSIFLFREGEMDGRLCNGVILTGVLC